MIPASRRRSPTHLDLLDLSDPAKSQNANLKKMFNYLDNVIYVQFTNKRTYCVIMGSWNAFPTVVLRSFNENMQ